MADRHVALIRGINVGRAKRVAMADLRALVLSLGYTDVRTVLNSGNVVFTGPRASPGTAAATDNPLLGVADNPSRLLVAVLANPADRSRLKQLVQQDWAPDALAIGARVAYLWCPEGVLASRLWKAVGRVLGDAVTTRNWATVTRLHALTRA